MPKTPEKSPPDILEILRNMGEDYICKPRNMKGKELIKHAGLIWAANHLDPNWESECELVYLDLETGSAVVRATVTVKGSRKVNFGEAARNNLGDMVKVYPVSMASTRALNCWSNRSRCWAISASRGSAISAGRWSCTQPTRLVYL